MSVDRFAAAYHDAARAHIVALQGGASEARVSLAYRAVLVAEREMHLDSSRDVTLGARSRESCAVAAQQIQYQIDDVDATLFLVVEDRHGDRHARAFHPELDVEAQVHELVDDIIPIVGTETIRHGVVVSRDAGAARLNRDELPGVYTYVNNTED